MYNYQYKKHLYLCQKRTAVLATYFYLWTAHHSLAGKWISITKGLKISATNTSLFIIGITYIKKQSVLQHAFPEELQLLTFHCLRILLWQLSFQQVDGGWSSSAPPVEKYYKSAHRHKIKHNYCCLEFHNSDARFIYFYLHVIYLMTLSDSTASNGRMIN